MKKPTTTQRRPMRESEEVKMRPPEGGYTEDKGDKFYVDPDMIPDGMTYQWSALTVLGKENRAGMVRDMRNEWTPVPADRHPEIGSDPQAPGTPYESAIVIEGLILMERPAEVTAYVRDVELRKAKAQVNNQMHRLKLVPDGTLGNERGERSVHVTRGRDLSIPEGAE